MYYQKIQGPINYCYSKFISLPLNELLLWVWYENLLQFSSRCQNNFSWFRLSYLSLLFLISFISYPNFLLVFLKNKCKNDWSFPLHKCPEQESVISPLFHWNFRKCPSKLQLKWCIWALSSFWITFAFLLCFRLLFRVYFRVLNVS